MQIQDYEGLCAKVMSIQCRIQDVVEELKDLVDRAPDANVPGSLVAAIQYMWMETSALMLKTGDFYSTCLMHSYAAQEDMYRKLKEDILRVKNKEQE